MNSRIFKISIWVSLMYRIFLSSVPSFKNERDKDNGDDVLTGISSNSSTITAHVQLDNESNTDMTNEPLARDLELRPENIDNSEHRCGFIKCLITLRNNNRGFLVARYGRSGRMLERMEMAYNFSLTVLEQEYGMKHIYAAPPYDMDIEDDVMWDMITHNHTRSYDGQGYVARFTLHNKGTRRLVVQPVNVIPSDEFIQFGCSKERLSSAFKSLYTLFPAKNRELAPNQDWTDKIHGIARTVSTEFETLFRLLGDYPALYDDFQMFLTSDGHIVHMDVDRIYSNGELRTKHGKQREAKCGTIIRIYKEKVLRYLEWVSGSNFTDILIS